MSRKSDPYVRHHEGSRPGQLKRTFSTLFDDLELPASACVFAGP